MGLLSSICSFFLMLSSSNIGQLPQSAPANVFQRNQCEPGFMGVTSLGMLLAWDQDPVRVENGIPGYRIDRAFSGKYKKENIDILQHKHGIKVAQLKDLPQEWGQVLADQVNIERLLIYCSLDSGDALPHILRSNRIKHLAIRESLLSDRVIQSVLKSNSLETLELLCRSGNNELRKLLVPHTSLHTLCIFGESVDEMDGKRIATCGIKNLILLHTKFDNTFLTSLSKSDSLRALKLDGCELSDQAVATLGQFTNVEVLTVKSCAIDNSAIAQISKLQKLEALDISGTRIDNVGIKQLLACKKLKDVCLGSVDDRTFRIISELPSLTALKCTGALDITDKGITHLAKVKTLRSLDFSSKTVTGESLTAGNFPNLQSLHVGYSPISCDGLKSIAKLPSLSSLTVWRAENVKVVSDEIVFTPTMQHLFLSGTTDSKLTIRSMDSLAKCKQLSTLQLRDCSFDRSAIAGLAANRSLQKLVLDAPKFADDSSQQVAEVVSKIKSLRVLEIRSLTIDNSLVTEFSRHRGLWLVILADTRLTRENLATLVSSNSIRSLRVWRTGLTTDDIQAVRSESPLIHIADD